MGLDGTSLFGRGYHSSATKPLPSGRLPHDLLEKHTVETLAVERDHMIRPSKIQGDHPRENWEKLIDKTRECAQPKVVIEMWNENATGWEHGPMSKGHKIRWTEREYVSRYRHVNAVNIRGAIQHARLIVLRLKVEWNKRFMWRPFTENPQPRSMGNLLTPPGLLSRKSRVSPPSDTRIYQAATESMPYQIGGWIQTDTYHASVGVGRTRTMVGDDKVP